MKRDELIYNMYSFVNSDEFLNKKVEKVGNEFVDQSTGIVYAHVIKNEEELNKILDEKIKFNYPVIFLSENPDIIKLIGDKFLLSEWSVERISDIEGSEFDYIFQIQHNAMGISKGVKYFESKSSTKTNKSS